MMVIPIEHTISRDAVKLRSEGIKERIKKGDHVGSTEIDYYQLIRDLSEEQFMSVSISYEASLGIHSRYFAWLSLLPNVPVPLVWLRDELHYVEPKSLGAGYQQGRLQQLEQEYRRLKPEFGRLHNAAKHLGETSIARQTIGVKNFHLRLAR